MDRNWVLSNADRPRGASLSARRAWIEIRRAIRPATGRPTRSLSARRAWIEIVHDFKLEENIQVALRKESVDRNKLLEQLSDPSKMVALRKESVDRNKCSLGNPCKKPWSLSARRAWIEMQGRWQPDGEFPCRSPQGERG